MTIGDGIGMASGMFMIVAVAWIFFHYMSRP